VVRSFNSLYDTELSLYILHYFLFSNLMEIGDSLNEMDLSRTSVTQK